MYASRYLKEYDLLFQSTHRLTEELDDGQVLIFNFSSTPILCPSFYISLSFAVQTIKCWLGFADAWQSNAEHGADSKREGVDREEKVKCIQNGSGCSVILSVP